MAKIWTMGEMIVEIMREKEEAPLYAADTFKGPYASGAPAIFIDTVGKLGGECGIFGGVGKDDFGKCILDKLKNDGVDCSNVLEDESLSTGCAFVTYFTDGSRKFIFHIGNTPAAKPKAPKALPQNSDYFHIMGCSVTASLEFGKEIVKTMEMFKNSGAKISFDPNIRPELMKNGECKKLIDKVLANTNIFMPGKSELIEMSGQSNVENAVGEMYNAYPQMELIVIKDGKNGCIVFDREDSYKFGIYDIKPLDSTGAGDSFDGAFIYSLSQNKSIDECMKTATACASLNTAAFGPMEGKISPESVEQMIKDNRVK